MRVEQLRAEFRLDFDLSAYDLKPGLPPGGLPRSEVYAGRVYPPGYVENLLQTARDAGIDMKRPAHIPNTRRAHEATEFAREQGKLWDFHHAVFKAYWVEERDIGEVAVLADVAASAGLDPAGLRAALESGVYAGAVEEQMQWAGAVGITGVPTFIFNERFAVVGAQDYAVFRDIAERIASGRLQSTS